MHFVKIQNFSTANPGSRFPAFAHLSPNECLRLRSAIAVRLGLHGDPQPLILLETLHAKVTPFTSVGDQTAFQLQNAISAAGFICSTDVLVNWYRFDDIDRIALSDLSVHFDDIWYPSSDDIEIFDESLDWFVSVRHDGLLSVLDTSH